MINTRQLCSVSLLTILLMPVFLGPGADADSYVYPEARICDQVDDYFGTSVADPYRWLEKVDSSETLEWIAGQNELWDSFLADIPVWSSIRERIEVLYDYERYSMPYRRGNYFFYVNDGLQEHSVFCYRETLDGEPVVLIDPNEFSAEKRLSLAGTTVSDDGSLLAWGTRESGSDWSTWYVMDIDTR